MDLFVHPLTGEILPADEDQIQAAVTAADKEIGRLYRARDVLMGPLMDMRGPAELPKPSKRTEKQTRIARCPRCMEKMPNDV